MNTNWFIMRKDIQEKLNLAEKIRMVIWVALNETVFKRVVTS